MNLTIEPQTVKILVIELTSTTINEVPLLPELQTMGGLSQLPPAQLGGDQDALLQELGRAGDRP